MDHTLTATATLFSAQMRRDVAVRVLQTCARGFLGRLAAKREREAEMALLGMVPPPPPPRESNPQARAAQVAERRRQLQAQRQQEMDKALVDLKRQLRAAEEEGIRETIQDKVNQWFVERRDPVTGAYPDFPEAENGGSRDIINPPPEAVRNELPHCARWAPGPRVARSRSRRALSFLW